MLFVHMKCRFSLSYRELAGMMIMRVQVLIILRCNGGFDALQDLLISVSALVKKTVNGRWCIDETKAVAVKAPTPAI
jgi:transposase-like protein